MWVIFELICPWILFILFHNPKCKHFFRKWYSLYHTTVLSEEKYFYSEGIELIIDRHEVGLWTHPLWRRLCKQINSFRWLSLKISNSSWVMTLKTPLRTIIKRFLQFIKSVCHNRQENFVIFYFFFLWPQMAVSQWHTFH